GPETDRRQGRPRARRRTPGNPAGRTGVVSLSPSPSGSLTLGRRALDPPPNRPYVEAHEVGACVRPPAHVRSLGVETMTTARRGCLQPVGTTLASAAMAGTAGCGAAVAPGAGGWKKAFMLGGVSSGPVLPHFQKLKEAGFEGVELISPNRLDRDEVLRAR